VNDERIEKGTLLRLEDASHGIRVEGVSGQAINGLGGKSDDLAGCQERDGFSDGGGAGEKARDHGGMGSMGGMGGMGVMAARLAGRCR
jgi:hypothetical protein